MRLIKPVLILIAGPGRADVTHIQLVLWTCHKADYVIINQVALLGNASHYMAAARRPLPLGWFKNTNLHSWEVQLLLLQIPSRSPEWGWTAGETLQTVLHTQDRILIQGHRDLAHNWKCHPGRYWGAPEFLGVFYLETHGTRGGRSLPVGRTSAQSPGAVTRAQRAWKCPLAPTGSCDNFLQCHHCQPPGLSLLNSVHKAPGLGLCLDLCLWGTRGSLAAVSHCKELSGIHPDLCFLSLQLKFEHERFLFIKCEKSSGWSFQSENFSVADVALKVTFYFWGI